MHNGGKWSVNIEAGVLFQGKPKVSNIKLTGVAKGILADLKLLKNDLSNGINKGCIRFYPVISLGFKYHPE